MTTFLFPRSDEYTLNEDIPQFIIMIPFSKEHNHFHKLTDPRQQYKTFVLISVN